MSTKYVAVLVILVIGIYIIPAYAAQLDVVIPKNSENINPAFQITRVITIQYEENSQLAELIGDMQHKIVFDINSENATTLTDKINSSIKEKSLAKVTETNGKYSAIIIPQKDSVTIEYKITLHPTIQDHFIVDHADMLDSNWRGFQILEEIPIKTEYGSYDINSPKSALAVAIPKALAHISESDAVKILDLRLIDLSGISELPLSKWESMFDPTAKMSETVEYGFTGSVVTNYSMGICTIYLKICQEKDYQEDFIVDNKEYHIKSIESQDDATIVIDGYVEESHLGDKEVFIVSDKAPPGVKAYEDLVYALYAIAGIGIITAVGFFVWSSKKSKTTSTEQTGIDPKDLYAVSIDSSAGSYQTNRSTAYLK